MIVHSGTKMLIGQEWVHCGTKMLIGQEMVHCGTKMLIGQELGVVAVVKTVYNCSHTTWHIIMNFSRTIYDFQQENMIFSRTI